MNVENVPVTPVNSPRPFSEIPGLWLKIGQMKEDFFALEILHTSIPNTLYGLVIYALVGSILGALQSLLGALINPLGNPAVDWAAATRSTVIFTSCFTLFVTPLSFYLNNAITFVGAMVFGGKGRFSSQAYLSSLFFVPLGLISSLGAFMSLIPRVGSWLVVLAILVVMVLNMLLTIRSFKVVHSLSTGKAAGAVLIPLILILLPLCLIAGLMMMGPVIGNVFSQINESLSGVSP